MAAVGVLVSVPAKINLTLDITGRRSDGYHLVHTVMQAITLREAVEVWRQEETGITLSVVGADLPNDGSNIAWKAADVFLKKTGTPLHGLGIRIHKRVPIGAGLAGGSADAAAVLAALNELTGTGLNSEKLCDLGAIVGADVPVCMIGGTAVGTGTGTVLSPLPPMPDCLIVVAKPPDSISTAEAYRRIDKADSLPVSVSGKMETAIRTGDLTAVAQNLTNAFDAVTDLPGVEAIKRIMRQYNTLGCQMTGSGSAVFGIFQENDAAERCVQALLQQFQQVFLCHPDKEGAKIK